MAPASSPPRRPPRRFSPGDACALATAGLTAVQTIRDIGRVKPAQRVLVVGASGGGSARSPVVGVARAKVLGRRRDRRICSASAADFRALPWAHLRSSSATRWTCGDDTQRYDVILDAAVAYSFGALRHLSTRRGLHLDAPGPGDHGLDEFSRRSLASARRLRGRGSRSVQTSSSAFAAVGGRWDESPRGFDRSPSATWPRRARPSGARRGMKGRVVITVEGGF